MSAKPQTHTPTWRNYESQLQATVKINQELIADLTKKYDTIKKQNAALIKALAYVKGFVPLKVVEAHQMINETIAACEEK